MNRISLLVSAILILLAAILAGLGYIEVELGTLILAAGLLIGGLSFFYKALSKPKASLSIKSVRFEKRTVDGVKGHQLKARVISKGVTKVTNLTASFEIVPLKLLEAVVSVDESGNRKVDFEEIPVKGVGYAWVTRDGGRVTGPLKELREGDHVGLVYPYKTFWLYVGKKGVESRTLLKLNENVEYKVTIEVRGEDPNGNPVTGRNTTTLKP